MRGTPDREGLTMPSRAGWRRRSVPAAPAPQGAEPDLETVLKRAPAVWDEPDWRVARRAHAELASTVRPFAARSPAELQTLARALVLGTCALSVVMLTTSGWAADWPWPLRLSRWIVGLITFLVIVSTLAVVRRELTVRALAGALDERGTGAENANSAPTLDRSERSS